MTGLSAEEQLFLVSMVGVNWKIGDFDFGFLFTDMASSLPLSFMRCSTSPLLTSFFPAVLSSDHLDGFLRVGLERALSDAMSHILSFLADMVSN